MSDEVTRRSYLQALLATGVVASTAGCNSPQDTSKTEATDTPTATSNQAPRILAHNATPKDNGTTLAVSLEGEDDHELNLARIEYGGETVEETPDTPSVEIDDEFTDLSTTTLNATPDQVIFLLRDSAGKETRTEVYPDETAPKLQTFSVEPTENASEVAVQLEGRDDTGLEQASMFVGEQTLLRENVSGRTEYNTGKRVSLPEDTRFKQNSVTASLTDWNGNATESEADTYVRKYDVMKETRLDVGVEYFPAGELMFDDCLAEGVDTEPAVGDHNYGQPIPSSIVSKHIDQMQGHGINRVQFTYEGPINDAVVEEFLDSPLINEVEVEASYWVSRSNRWTEDADMRAILEEDMKYLRDNFLSRENAATYDGRNTAILNASKWPIIGVRDEWNSYEAFVEEIRSYLTVGGTEPFLVAETGWPGYKGIDGKFAELFEKFDAVTNSQPPFHPESEGIVPWEENSEYREQKFQNNRDFAQTHDMEFFPRAMVGFDSRANTCWGHSTTIPRSPENLHHDLRRAEEYGTSDRLHVFTWNDFTEGTQIEPGTFRGNDYGTDYVEVVKNFQTPN